MILAALLFLPSTVQGGLMLVDEFYYHMQRGLPRWERISHPIDTLATLACLVFALTMDFSETNLIIYISLCSFSSILITKDEFVHRSLCKEMEMWIHALLFVVHPAVLLAAGFFWFFRNSTGGGLLGPESATTALALQTLVLTSFFIYQVLFWGIYARTHNHQQ